MEHRTVQFQHDLRRELLENLPEIVDEKYFSDLDFRPKYDNGIIKATNLHYLEYSDDGNELNYVNDIFTKAEIIVGSPHFMDKPDSTDWDDQIVQFNIRIEMPDVDLTHEDIIQWERFEEAGRSTGRLKIADSEILDEDIDPVRGIRAGIRHALEHKLPEHAGRSEVSGIPLNFVENATPEDWEKVSEISPL